MEERLIRVEEGLKTVGSDLGEIKTALVDIASSMKMLAVLEEKHTHVKESLVRSFQSIEKMNERVERIERALPNLILASSWVFKAVIAIMALLGTGALMTILKGAF